MLRRFLKNIAIAAVIVVAGLFSVSCVVPGFPSASQPVSGVSETKYRQLLELVEDVRNPNFEEVIDNLLSKSGKAENYSFLEDYTAKFDGILGEEYTPEEKQFCDCCYYVWYTEYEAKRYKWYSNNSGVLNYLYEDKAKSYRQYADTLYDMLTSAKSDTDLNSIKTYCVDHKIISG